MYGLETNTSTTLSIAGPVVIGRILTKGLFIRSLWVSLGKPTRRGIRVRLPAQN